mmetsp:Transcript_11679/g.37295  ORF Transcript_11679/g.37295 Transcript_11679/m.37295 type:complete len:225 (+) Transcript_11679:138-812(+)
MAHHPKGKRLYSSACSPSSRVLLSHQRVLAQAAEAEPLSRASFASSASISLALPAASFASISLALSAACFASASASGLAAGSSSFLGSDPNLASRACSSSLALASRAASAAVPSSGAASGAAFGASLTSMRTGTGGSGSHGGAAADLATRSVSTGPSRLAFTSLTSFRSKGRSSATDLDHLTPRSSPVALIRSSETSGSGAITSTSPLAGTASLSSTASPRSVH